MEVEDRQIVLRKFLKIIRANELRIQGALAADLRKPRFESFISEILPLENEIEYQQRHLKCWAKPKRLYSKTLSHNHLFASCYEKWEPLGSSLILAPWNYPFYLSLIPLAAAVAAGCRVSLKPSELAPHSADLIKTIVSECFEPSHVQVFLGGPEVSQELLKKRWDKIFFTGSGRVGKLVMHAAAEHLCPVTLELGGKSPTILDDTAPMETSLRRIFWAKFFNAGQTCVAPDYLLVPEKRRAEFEALAPSILEQDYGRELWKSSEYSKIVNAQHFQRLQNILRNEKLVWGGGLYESERLIQPSIVYPADWSSISMQGEIFGPILPVLFTSDMNQSFKNINSLGSPLVLYIFSSDEGFQKRAAQAIASGAVVMNDALLQLSHPQLSFGGVGASGFGRYRGESGFQCFSYRRSYEKKGFWPELPWRYRPYREDFAKRFRSWL